MSEVTTVPRQSGGVLAYLVCSRLGDWAVGQTCHAGFFDADVEDPMFPPSLSTKRLAWMGADEFYGLCVPYDWNEADLEEGLKLVQVFTGETLKREATVAKMEGRRSGFTIHDLRRLAKRS